MKCSVCKRDWPEGTCKVIKLTEEEQQFARQAGETDTEYAYCPPCWRVLSDKQMGAQFLKGHFQVQLRSQGVLDAEERAQKFYSGLLALKPKQ